MMLTYSQRNAMAKHYTAKHKREAAEYAAQVKAEADKANRERIEANRAAAEAEKVRVKFTREDLTAARLIRTRNGWRKVAKINAKTVSVETGYSWVDRIPFDKITEYRT